MYILLFQIPTLIDPLALGRLKKTSDCGLKPMVRRFKQDLFSSTEN